MKPALLIALFCALITAPAFALDPHVEAVSRTAEAKGREHHPWAFSSWLAGAGVKRGIVHGNSDEIGLRAVEKPVHVHDFHATILHLMGFDHEKLTFRQAGLDYRLTGVEESHAVKEVLA